jgi:hypothetical protein
MAVRISLSFCVSSVAFLCSVFHGTASLEAQNARATTVKRGIREVVLDGTTGTFTHKEYIAPGKALRLRFNVHDVDDIVSNIELRPNTQLFVRQPGDLLAPNVTTLHKDVLDLESDSDVDFNVQAFWKKLLGRRVTVEIEEAGLSAKLEAVLDRDDGKKSSFDGELKWQDRSRHQVSGEFLGYGKGTESDDPVTLKLLAGQDRKLTEIPEDAIVSIDFHGALSKDLDRALAILKAKYSVDKRELIIVRVGPEIPPKPATKAAAKQSPNSTITYQHAVKQWQVRLRGELDANREKMAVTASAQIWNETPYDWSNVKVTLKKGDAEYLLSNVTLPSQQTNLFPITFVPTSIGKPSTGIALGVERQVEIVAPPDDEVTTAQQLPCHEKLVLSNTSDHFVPKGTLAVYDNGNNRLGEWEIEDIPPDAGRTAARITLPTKKDLVASYTKKKDEIVEVVGIQGYNLLYYRGRVSSFEFKSPDSSYGIVNLPSPVETHPSPVNIRLSDSKEQTRISIVLRLEPEAGYATLKPMKVKGKGHILFIRERPESKSSESKNLVTWPVADLKQLRDTLTVPRPLSDALSRIILQKQKVEDLETQLEGLEKQLDELEGRTQVYTVQVQSSYHGAILRRFATQAQGIERRIADTRNKLAIARYGLEHYISTESVRQSSDAHVKQIHDLGGYAEASHDETVFVMFGSGYPANQIQDHDLEALGKSSSLEQVSLRGCLNITDGGASHLVGLSNLKWLVLDGTSITDGGLEYLYGLKKLRFLDLRNTSVTEAGIRRLQAQLPECLVSL